jgi:hypothetical protein
LPSYEQAKRGAGQAAFEVVQELVKPEKIPFVFDTVVPVMQFDRDKPNALPIVYIQFQQAEAVFRTSKNDLALRPLYHQRTERVEAHILVCFLALALWRTLEMWMRSKGMGTCARQLLLEVSTIRSMDVILPVKNRAQLRLRVVARPDKPVAQLLAHLGLALPNSPKIVQNVVEKIA